MPPASTICRETCADCTPLLVPLVVAEATTVVPVRIERVNWSVEAARAGRSLRTVSREAGVTVSVAASGAINGVTTLVGALTKVASADATSQH